MNVHATCPRCKSVAPMLTFKNKTIGPPEGWVSITITTNPIQHFMVCGSCLPAVLKTIRGEDTP